SPSTNGTAAAPAAGLETPPAWTRSRSSSAKTTGAKPSWPARRRRARRFPTASGHPRSAIPGASRSSSAEAERAGGRADRGAGGLQAIAVGDQARTAVEAAVQGKFGEYRMRLAQGTRGPGIDEAGGAGRVQQRGRERKSVVEG